ncbi:MAG TPA: amylo-alpha-1,6-glucosidase [Gammaproteobacteria bacterium]|nr:amylo-alpha-1,6-glucosidase [Gammaproteobacteria bacterium]MEC8010981.1 amylo-alpha-1,6-glucosidase [Pseudomonadota bacterium]HBF07668.1 amylo-alpha-1,6-glucosidase [Gammaproteobacteria bacterium]HCK94125.1 amylo-alpha-1,6-glucosidase [Gammaproteobacteria bacterium]|tara:strand:- start:23897 stop:26032 length:2136 start_codon:yes stop_codon:yes gene_type:complete
MDETIQIDSRTYVLTSSSRVDNRTRVLKRGDTFAVYDWNGEIGKVGSGSLGLYHLGTRHLAQWEITVEDRRPMPLNSTIREDNSVLLVDQTTPDILVDEKTKLSKGTIHLRRELAVQNGQMIEDLTVTNYADQAVELDLAYVFDADYKDIFEVRGMVRAETGKQFPHQISENEVHLSYCGLDDVRRETKIHFSEKVDELTEVKALFTIKVEAQQQFKLTSTIDCISDQAFEGELQALKCDTPLDSAEITTDNEQFNDWLERSMADLRMLTTFTQHGPYPYAGVPWYATPFGRDAIITALQTLWIQPELSKGVLNFLAATQATHFDDVNEAQPGKIIHELREGEMATLGEIPFRRYYGTVDATPLFVVLAGRYFLRTQDLPFIQSIWPNILNALEWVEKHGDCDGDGFVEYARSTEKGLLQQGWKDSWNSIFHEDGSDAKAPIALSEVQAYVYEAYEMAEHLAKAQGYLDMANVWEIKRFKLKEAFNEKFWDEELGTYVLALDGDKKPCRVKSSNAGHALYSGIATPERAAKLAESLTSVKAFNGWGLRTIYHGEARYNPMSYHNGSVWPHDTAMAAYGLARYGYKDEANLFMTGLYDASNFWELSRLPELFCGFTRLQGQGPTNYPVACIPQAWAAGCVYMFLQAVLGIEFSVEQPIVFRKPKLPPYINRLRISNLKYGSSQFDLVLRRRGSDVALHAENKTGNIDIVVLV